MSLGKQISAIEEAHALEQELAQIHFEMKYKTNEKGERIGAYYEFSAHTKMMLQDSFKASTPLKRKLFQQKIRRGGLTREHIEKFIREAVA